VRRGSQAVSASGAPCLAWDDPGIPFNAYWPNAPGRFTSTEKNYCRNPGFNSLDAPGPWCASQRCVGCDQGNSGLPQSRLDGWMLALRAAAGGCGAASERRQNASTESQLERAVTLRALLSRAASKRAGVS